MVIRTSGRPCDTAATQRLRSSSTASPGSSDAVWPSGPSPSRVISNNGRAGSSDRGAVVRLQRLLVARGGLVGRAVGRHGVDVFRRHRRLWPASPRGSSGSCFRDDRTERIAHRPSTRDALPGKALAERVRGQQPVERLRRRAAGQRDAERARCRERRRRHPFGDMPRERQRIRQYLNCVQSSCSWASP